MPERMVYNQTDCWKGLQNGDPEALGYLYDTYADKLFDAALWVTGNRELIKDSLQDVFIDIWNYRASLGNVTHTYSYLVKVLHNIIFKKLKASSAAPIFIEEEVVYNSQNAEEKWIAADMENENISRLKNACMQLTERQQTVIRLRYYDGLSYKQIAARLRMNYQS
ncbi:MAG: sigma-70 family RNA polymerase sigma factor, partial [Chitinophagaceae bacterium]|nr:sigma-70 family RNA polymerase sigma factor [Chitinophagaceae bacterium]